MFGLQKIDFFLYISKVYESILWKFKTEIWNIHEAHGRERAKIN